MHTPSWRRMCCASSCNRDCAVVVAGVIVGVLLALAPGHMLASLLYATSPRDPVVLITVALVLLVVAAAASVVPAWRASRVVDPMEALRAE